MKDFLQIRCKTKKVKTVFFALISLFLALACLPLFPWGLIGTALFGWFFYHNIRLALRGNRDLLLMVSDDTLYVSDLPATEMALKKDLILSGKLTSATYRLDSIQAITRFIKRRSLITSSDIIKIRYEGKVNDMIDLGAHEQSLSRADFEKMFAFIRYYVPGLETIDKYYKLKEFLSPASQTR